MLRNHFYDTRIYIRSNLRNEISGSQDQYFSNLETDYPSL